MKRYLSVVIPAYNEGGNIFKNVSGVISALKDVDDFEIIIVNDGSCDNTLKELKVLKKQYDMIRIVSYKNNRGKGHAVRRGILRSEGRYVAVIDADAEIPPAQIEVLLKKLVSLRHKDKKIKGVIGSKMDKRSDVHFPLYRRAMSLMYYEMIRHMFDLGVQDTNTGIKVFDGRSVRNAALDLHTTGFAYDVEMLLGIKLRNGRICQAPIKCVYKREKMHFKKRKVAETIIETLRIYKNYKYYQNIKKTLPMRLT